MNTRSDFPQPGHLILVQRSEWYALADGEMLRVCEIPCWIENDSAIYVAPRRQVRTFWGPANGAPDGVKPMEMSTSGGPFKTVPAEELDGLEQHGTLRDSFWHWQDWPRAGGGVEYEREVTLWQLPLLIDHHHRKTERYRKEASHE